MKLQDKEVERIYKKVSNPAYEKGEHERIVSISSQSIGALRKELVDTIGQERTKGFLLRYGWHAGVADGKRMIEHFGEHAEELVMAGAEMHVYHGWTLDVDVVNHHTDFENKKMHVEATWKQPYEAEEYLNLFGESDHAVCHTMTGYASGYLSTILGHQVIVVEDKCEAKGDGCCRSICRTVEEWEEEIATELMYYEPNSLIDELQLTYDELKVERDNLKKAFEAHELLMSEIHSGNDISSVIQLLNKLVDKPAMFVDKYEKDIVASAGMDGLLEDSRVHTDLEAINATTIVRFEDHRKLLTPVYVQKQVVGYCGLIIDDGEQLKELDQMILERAALTCGNVLLNEKTSLDTKQKIGGDFLGEILSGTITDAELNKRAYYLGFEQLTPFFIITLDVNASSEIKRKIECNQKVMEQIYFYFESGRQGNGRKVLIEQKAEQIVILCYQDATLETWAQKENMLSQLINYCGQRFKQYQFSGGISSSATSLDDASTVYKESLAALKVASEHRPIVSYEHLGVEGLLFQLDEDNMMDKMIEKSLGKLLREDKDMELTKTLYYYLKNGCNLQQTARSMNFSVSGLRYRLQRINDVLETRVNNPDVTYQLFLALKALMFLGKLDIDMDIDLLEEQEI
ncbi:XylR N-terminal domain-containing protein [Virgibacillus xinjiangensis]|uniref:XylR N-terminal domain-containing protein n=1 Tax=Virgibacillus xinjiangensis TaxID=393090 RepID=A0ABV7CX12_9BACI